MSSVAQMPVTTFPRAEASSEIDKKIEHLLINSDPNECNTNFSMVLKAIVDELKVQKETYHTCSVLALKLLRSNLLVRNIRLCVGKLLGLIHMLSENLQADPQESLHLKQLVLIILLLLLKLKEDQRSGICIDHNLLLKTLRALGFAKIMGNFITRQIELSESGHESFVILKFSCDIVFQYLYHIILLSDEEFEALTESPLIPTLISHLLSNDSFNHYNLEEDDFEDESRLIAYEEFKLLLLINEQYMMMSLSANVKENKVFEGLLAQRRDSVNGISGFTNLLVFHMNREESHIIKILMLKFLYVIFTTSSSAKLPYLNDLKILIDIMIRELNDMSYTGEDQASNSFLALTYLKVLYPMLMFSQISELDPGYKAKELVDMLRNIVVNCDVNTTDKTERPRMAQFEQASKIVKFAVLCLSIPWLKSANRAEKLMSNANTSMESVSSASSLTNRVANLKIQESTSSDQHFLSQVASVRTSTENDYHKSITSHNLSDDNETSSSMFEDNNHNVFLSPKKSHDSASMELKDTVVLLNLPKEYLLNKRLPPLPPDMSQDRSSGNLSPFSPEHAYSQSTLMPGKVTMPRKSPPPPPPPPRRRHY
ncbi:hypothetical protein FOB63_003450 [Clavispora lusitaniae]|uniref:SPIN90/Ldb17 leucine-rich domain-containing protein n=2 Tax=Clavispora lusitaniae TaxID=36911 RepID=C4Y830_CLAL4|nr:uncharacterized protein CLUG_04358 [Clavispora lusitaniae ATCC 42720]EEQ40230.1 hypothetical protein CLUG_04358 [Clavispora lusitaniae ATCC 42720]KAF5209786.1 hypothetical protein E0198_004098 [Clavispora lusitaniae]KAF7581827.1 hypothetical protein FOB63_003450 [Clavispora lusitaniae]OVF09668.1 hypothetical protein A9F13_04g01518 [Clavispora lusitaniae]